MTAEKPRLYRSDTLAACTAAGRTFKHWIEWYAACACRREERLYLSQMDERMLKDIGVNRLDAMREASKPFWK